MSRSKEIINRPFHFVVVRDVFLNRDGIKIGQIVKWNRKRAYLTWRRDPSFGSKGEGHYFIKYQGFGLDRSLFWNMVRDDRIDLIIIQYKGKTGLRYFIANIDDWAMYSVPVNYTKEVDNTLETYGSQIVLCESFMDEFEVRPNVRQKSD